MKVKRHESESIFVVSKKEAISLLAVVSAQLQTERNILKGWRLENGELFDIQIDFDKEE